MHCKVVRNKFVFCLKWIQEGMPEIAVMASNALALMPLKQFNARIFPLSQWAGCDLWACFGAQWLPRGRALRPSNTVWCCSLQGVTPSPGWVATDPVPPILPAVTAVWRSNFSASHCTCCTVVFLKYVFFLSNLVCIAPYPARVWRPCSQQYL